MPNPPLLIVGASARAAAQCACRAGFAPWCVDLFGDLDLQAIAEVRVVPAPNYPQAIPKLLEGWAPAVAPLMFTGALENHPEAIEGSARERPLWGTPPEALRRSRDPFFVADALQGPRLHVPNLARHPGRIPADGTWLLKPTRGGGGRGIRPYRGEPLTSYSFLQERIEGENLAVFLTDSGRTVLVGLSRQLVGEPWLNAKPFAYCGSVGPLPEEPLLAAGVLDSIARLASRLGLRGLFGVDLIRNNQGFWLIEINPRFTASVELYELAYAEPLLRWHARCFTEPAPLRDWERQPPRPKRRLGKAIWFLPMALPQGLSFPELDRCIRQLRSDDPWAVPDLADIPAAGTPLEAGQPLVTLFVEDSAADPDMLEAKLRAKADAFALEFRKALEIGHVRAAE